MVQHRLKTEYDCDVRLKGSQYTGARWITADTPAELREFENAYPAHSARRRTRWLTLHQPVRRCGWPRSASQDPFPPGCASTRYALRQAEKAVATLRVVVIGGGIGSGGGAPHRRRNW